MVMETEFDKKLRELPLDVQQDIEREAVARGTTKEEVFKKWENAMRKVISPPASVYPPIQQPQKPDSFDQAIAQVEKVKMMREMSGSSKKSQRFTKDDLMEILGYGTMSDTIEKVISKKNSPQDDRISSQLEDLKKQNQELQKRIDEERQRRYEDMILRLEKKVDEMKDQKGHKGGITVEGVDQYLDGVVKVAEKLGLQRGGEKDDFLKDAAKQVIPSIPPLIGNEQERRNLELKNQLADKELILRGIIPVPYQEQAPQNMPPPPPENVPTPPYPKKVPTQPDPPATQ